MACVISAISSNSGKTLLSLLLISWLKSINKTVQTFKVGPDYLDPQQLTAVSKKACRNLDLVLSGESWVKENFNYFGGLTDYSFVEGVMGLFDGIGSSSKGSTAELAKVLSLPVVLIVDARGKAASIAALIKGFIEHFKMKNLCLSGGVSLNCVLVGKMFDWYPGVNIFCDPIPYDAGLTIGGCRYVWHHILDNPRIYDNPKNTNGASWGNRSNPIGGDASIWADTGVTVLSVSSSTQTFLNESSLISFLFSTSIVRISFVGRSLYSSTKLEISSKTIF